MNKDFNWLGNYQIKDNLLNGIISIKGVKKPLKVVFDLELEEEIEEIKDFNELIANSKQLINSLTREAIEQLLLEISTELNESSYSQSDYKPNERDILHLKNDLKIQEIIFYEDGAMVMLESQKYFEDAKIHCQINEGLEIEDLSVS